MGSWNLVGFLKTNLAKFTAIWVEKGQKEGFLRSKRPKSHWGRKRKWKIARARRKKEGEKKTIIVALLVLCLHFSFGGYFLTEEVYLELTFSKILLEIQCKFLRICVPWTKYRFFFKDGWFFQGTRSTSNISLKTYTWQREVLKREESTKKYLKFKKKYWKRKAISVVKRSFKQILKHCNF